MKDRFFKNIKFCHWVFVVFCIVGCTTKERENGTAVNIEVKKDFRQLEQEAQRLPIDEQASFWKSKIQEISYSRLPEVKARMYYRLAGTYYNKGDLDSLNYYMRKAWDVLEGVDADSEILTLLNYGEGNIATIEGNIHLENYYFNLAAQFIVSDSLMDLTPVQKASIFMATAQSDARLNQYSQAMIWNRKAIQNLQYDEAPVRLQYRAYRQLANNFRLSSEGSLDSVYHYIQIIDTLWQNNRETINPRFLYDEKAHYYQELHKFDSAVVYHHKILKLDEEILEAEPRHPPSHTNLFKDYINLSQNYLQLNEIEQAENFMRMAEDFIAQDSTYLTDVEYLLFREALVNYYFNTQQYDRAFAEYNLLSEKNKAVYENKYTQSIAEMATIYKLRANENHIMNLNQQVLMTENKLAQNRLWLIIAGLSALLAIAIVVILYFGRKQLILKEEKEKVQLQKRAMELQQQLLRTQMEPHFIFNTLAALQSYIRIEEKDKALRYLNQFSRLLRNSLELSRENWVPMDDEIETLEYYLGLQQMRYDDSFDYEIKKSDTEEDYQVLIPPMLIQPFVENAILYGVSNTSERGKIEIKLNLRNDALEVVVIDNGPGIKTLKQKPDGKKKSLSTTISRERLAILAKEKGIEVQVNILDRNEMDKNLTGTQVELIIPIERDF
ncbi:sensor histidine kinase [Sphingobacterium gobiense]|uniref:Signal transduction histidine kinase internal region domain-containing protein n=1 Tax=Sphingobacterium gobiense TaxID=1382456 RepID=A0A2S9JV15_9SPHI|nr:histidine kinase [Sphingobacterium gobiense]PRD57083.1 hypothetical protein C5749_07720 [Sphingobacterium gobiense]